MRNIISKILFNRKEIHLIYTLLSNYRDNKFLEYKRYESGSHSRGLDDLTDIFEQ